MEESTPAADRFTALYRAHSRRVFELCLRMSGDRAQAMELAQDVFVQLWRKLDQLSPERDAGPWVWRVAVNTTLNGLRARRRRLRREEPSADLSAYVAPSSVSTPLPVRRMDIGTALRRLPPRARAVFLLHDVEGYAHDEIASLMNIAPGTVRAQLHRARALMRETLSP